MALDRSLLETRHFDAVQHSPGAHVANLEAQQVVDVDVASLAVAAHGERADDVAERPNLASDAMRSRVNDAQQG